MAVALIAHRLPVVPGIAVVGAGLLVVVSGEDSPLPALLTGIAMTSFYAVMRLAVRLSETNEQANGWCSNWSGPTRPKLAPPPSPNVNGSLARCTTYSRIRCRH